MATCPGGLTFIVVHLVWEVPDVTDADHRLSPLAKPSDAHALAKPHPVCLVDLGSRDRLPAIGIASGFFKSAVVGFVALHFILAPLILPVQAMAMKYVGETLAKVHDTLPEDPRIECQTFVFVNSLACLADVA